MTNIYSLTFKELEDYLSSLGENKAKAKIIFKALYREKISDFSRISILKKSLIDNLSKNFYIKLPVSIKESIGQEATKVLFSLEDDRLIEAVLMRQKYGNSVCVSTQIGCNMGCKFCQSGKNKKERNLTSGEIVSQIMYMEKTLGEKISTVAIMGIGEPFDNYDEIIKFINIITSDYGLGIGIRHVTLSTCGIVPKIIEYSTNDNISSLAISLHAPNNEIRDSLMPINKAYPLEMLISSLEDFSQKTNRKIFLEYVMLQGINDSKDNAKQLSNLVKNLKCTVNLIPYNETNSMGFKRSSFETIMDFYHILKDNGVHATIRKEFGSEVDAACGQLKSKHLGV